MSEKCLRIGVVLLIAALLAACAGRNNGGGTDEAEASPRAAVRPDGSIHLTAQQVKLAGIRTAPAEERGVTRNIMAPGVVKPREAAESQVFSPFPGRVIADPSRLPHVGSLVKRGEVLAQVEQILNAATRVQFKVDDIQLQSAIDQAQNEVALAGTEYQRSKALYQVGAIPLKQEQTAEFNDQQAQTRLASAKKAKAQYEEAEAGRGTGPRRVDVVSPLDGVVVAANITPGEQIDATTSLFTVADLSRVWVEAAVFENDLGYLRQVHEAKILTRAYPGQVFTGRLLTVGNMVDPVNRTAAAIFAVANPDRKLKIGMFAEAEIPTGRTQNSIVVPATALLEAAGGPVVYVETQPNDFVARPVMADERQGSQVVIQSGLSPGEIVVTQGGETLRSESLRFLIHSRD